MRQRAHADPLHARRGDRRHRFEIHSARGLQFDRSGADLIAQRHRAAATASSDMLSSSTRSGPAGEHFAPAARACRLRLRRSSPAPGFRGHRFGQFAGPPHGFGRREMRRASAGGAERQVVVLDQDGVEQARCDGCVRRRSARRISPTAASRASSCACRRCARRCRRTASTYCRVSVAMPDRRPIKFSTIRSAVSRLRAGPSIVASVWPAATCVAIVDARRPAKLDVHFGKCQLARPAVRPRRRGCRDTMAASAGVARGNQAERSSNRTAGPDLRAPPAAQSAGSRPRPLASHSICRNSLATRGLR